jgi:Epoxide hydrolase N terminus
MSSTVETATEVRPFHVDVPEEVLDDLRRRIQATRLPSKELVDDRSQGVQLVTIRELARYWTKDYDFGRIEARLNALPQFVTEIDGVDVHFSDARQAVRRGGTAVLAELAFEKLVDDAGREVPVFVSDDSISLQAGVSASSGKLSFAATAGPGSSTSSVGRSTRPGRMKVGGETRLTLSVGWAVPGGLLEVFVRATLMCGLH